MEDVPLQTVTPAPGTACAAVQFHREYGAASNPKQLVPGVYQLEVKANDQRQERGQEDLV